MSKYSFWGPKGRRFGLWLAKTTSFYLFPFFKSTYIKTMSFRAARVQNDIVLNMQSLIQNDAVLDSGSPKRRRFNMWF